MNKEDKVLELVKKKCPKMLIGCLPNDAQLRKMIRSLAKIKGKELK